MGIPVRTTRRSWRCMRARRPGGGRDARRHPGRGRARGDDHAQLDAVGRERARAPWRHVELPRLPRATRRSSAPRVNDVRDPRHPRRPGAGGGRPDRRSTAARSSRAGTATPPSPLGVGAVDPDGGRASSTATERGAGRGHRRHGARRPAGRRRPRRARRWREPPRVRGRAGLLRPRHRPGHARGARRAQLRPARQGPQAEGRASSSPSSRWSWPATRTTDVARRRRGPWSPPTARWARPHRAHASRSPTTARRS